MSNFLKTIFESFKLIKSTSQHTFQSQLSCRDSSYQFYRRQEVQQIKKEDKIMQQNYHLSHSKNRNDFQEKEFKKTQAKVFGQSESSITDNSLEQQHSQSTSQKQGFRIKQKQNQLSSQGHEQSQYSDNSQSQVTDHQVSTSMVELAQSQMLEDFSPHSQNASTQQLQIDSKRDYQQNSMLQSEGNFLYKNAQQFIQSREGQLNSQISQLSHQQPNFTDPHGATMSGGGGVGNITIHQNININTTSNPPTLNFISSQSNALVGQSQQSQLTSNQVAAQHGQPTLSLAQKTVPQSFTYRGPHKEGSIQNLNHIHRSLIESVVNNNPSLSKQKSSVQQTSQSQMSSLSHQSSQQTSHNVSQLPSGLIHGESSQLKPKTQRGVETNNLSALDDVMPLNTTVSSKGKSILDRAVSRNRRSIMQNLSEMIEEQQHYNRVHSQLKQQQEESESQLPVIQQKANQGQRSQTKSGSQSPTLKKQQQRTSSQAPSPQRRAQLRGADNQLQQDSQALEEENVIKEIELMKDERYPQFKQYKEREQQIENKFKEYFVINKNTQEKFLESNQLAIQKHAQRSITAFGNSRLSKNQERSFNMTGLNLDQSDMGRSMTSRLNISALDRDQRVSTASGNSTSRMISTSYMKGRTNQILSHSSNSQQFAGALKSSRSADRFIAQSRAGKRGLARINQIYGVPSRDGMTERRREAETSHTVGGMIDLFGQSDKASSLSPDQHKISEMMEDLGFSLYYFSKDTQQLLDSQLVRLRKFSIDFQISQKIITDSMVAFFKISERQLREEMKSPLIRYQFGQGAGGTLDASFDSQDSNHRSKVRDWILHKRQSRFEELKKRTEGVTWSLQSFCKDIAKGALSLHQEELLKKRVGLLDFLTELNDCQKNILRLLGGVTSENCLPMYALDFLWKLLLVRIEYHLSDEEQRLQKVQKYFDAQLKREVAEVQYSVNNKEEQYKEIISKLEKQRDSMQQRIDKLMTDKGELLDAIRDKEDDLQLLKTQVQQSALNLRKYGHTTALSESPFALELFSGAPGQKSSQKNVLLRSKTISSTKKRQEHSEASPDGSSPQLMKEGSSNTIKDRRRGRSGQQDSSLSSDSELNEQSSPQVRGQDQYSQAEESFGEEEQLRITSSVAAMTGNQDLAEVFSQATPGSRRTGPSSKKTIKQSQQQQFSEHLDQQFQNDLERAKELRYQEKLEQKKSDMPIVQLNKSKGLPNYRAVDERMMSTQLSKLQSQSYSQVSRQKGQLYSALSQQQQQQQIQASIVSQTLSQTSAINKVKVVRTRDQQLQTEVDQDFICSKCLLRSTNEENDYQRKKLQSQHHHQASNGGSRLDVGSFGTDHRKKSSGQSGRDQNSQPSYLHSNSLSSRQQQKQVKQESKYDSLVSEAADFGRKGAGVTFEGDSPSKSRQQRLGSKGTIGPSQNGGGSISGGVGVKVKQRESSESINSFISKGALQAAAENITQAASKNNNNAAIDDEAFKSNASFNPEQPTRSRQGTVVRNTQQLAREVSVNEQSFGAHRDRTQSLLNQNSFLMSHQAMSRQTVMQSSSSMMGSGFGHQSLGYNSFSANHGRMQHHSNFGMSQSNHSNGGGFMGMMNARLTLADQLNHESKEIIIMPEQTLIKQVEELLEKKFENDERLILLIKQYQMQSSQQSQSSSMSTSPGLLLASQPLISSQALIAYQNSNSQQDLLQFAFTHFLTQQGLKSLALRYLNSLYSGLRKIYLKSPQEYQYAQFLMQIFGFNPEEFPAFRPDQVRVALKVRHLFQLVQKNQATSTITQLSRTRLTNGGVISLLEFIPFLYKACRCQAKGVFANILNHLELSELSYRSDQLTQQMLERHFVAMKIFLLLSYSRIELSSLTMKTEAREVQMDVVLMHLEETLEVKLNKSELSVFKKEFENFFLVPLKQLEHKLHHYTAAPVSSHTSSSASASQTHLLSKGPDFQVSLLVLMNMVLEEWEVYQAQQKKKLLKKFIDFDENGDGVLTLDEFRELMKNLEGSTINNERVVLLFKEAVEMSNELEQIALKNGGEDSPRGGSGGNGANSIGYGNGGAGIPSSDKISPECFVETVVKHRLGGYGNEFLDFEFLNQQLQLQRLQKEKEKNEKEATNQHPNLKHTSR